VGGYVVTLEEYLSGDYHVDQQDLIGVARIIAEVVPTFALSVSNSQWPYGLIARNSFPINPNTEPSHGTSAMILTALGRLIGWCAPPGGKPTAETIDAGALRSAWRVAALRLAKSLIGRRGTWSESFKDNDPLTISHVADLISALARSPKNKVTRERLSMIIPDAVSRIEALAKANPADETSFRAAMASTPFSINGFIVLRIARAKCDLDGTSRFDNSDYRRFFESRLHDQLSYSSIPDSRFDPAELAFCLEGLLLCAPEAVDPSLFERVLEVLAEKQAASAYWRPNTPFWSEQKGQIMLPLSVEGANSLMRSIAVMDGRKLHGTFSEQAVPMLRRFWQWVRARKVQIEVSGERCSGWHSEHVNSPDLLHLWDTSQVLEFLNGYRNLLDRHVADKTLLLSRLASPVSPTDRPRDWRSGWAKITQQFEPSKAADKHTQTYRKLYSDFIRPWGDGKPTNFSMLLYGPPGTGKSQLAQNVAIALGLRMITVTVSDFLGRGGEFVESRVKAIFQTLEAQSDAVILFDEIDAFLLDRDSDFYREQDTLFQFLTPGMLTKINDLRTKHRCIFIIATNYANRIDPAIKRTGRIDKRYLLSLPDRKQRLAIVEGLVGRPPSNANEIAASSLYFGYSDIRGAVQDAGGKNATDPAILSRMSEREPSTSLLSYARRIEEENYPKDEVAELAGMAKEVGRLDVFDEAIRVVPIMRRRSFKRYLH
jgi:hypothetical protein